MERDQTATGNRKRFQSRRIGSIHGGSELSIFFAASALPSLLSHFDRHLGDGAGRTADADRAGALSAR
jgi:hypothetical protein